MPSSGILHTRLVLLLVLRQSAGAQARLLRNEVVRGKLADGTS